MASPRHPSKRTLPRPPRLDLAHLAQALAFAKRDATLTPRQAQLLDYCVAEGYYEIPRRATLGGLAASLGISAPSLSLSLRRAENRLVKASTASRHA